MTMPCVMFVGSYFVLFFSFLLRRLNFFLHSSLICFLFLLFRFHMRFFLGRMECIYSIDSRKKNLTCGRHSIHSFTDQELHEVRIQMFLSLEFPYNISFSFLFRVALFAIVVAGVAGFFFVILFQWKDYISVRIHFQTGRRQSNRPNSFNWL